jgi:hypothetical protein
MAAHDLDIPSQRPFNLVKSGYAVQKETCTLRKTTFGHEKISRLKRS